MIEQHTGGLPAPSESVLAALRGIHAGLYVVRSRYALDQLTGKIVVNAQTQEPIERPRYWLCIDHRGQKSPLFPVQTPEGEYMPCDMRLVRRVGTDLGVACESFQEMCAAEDEADRLKEEKRQESERERVRRWAENNRQAMRAAQENAKNGVVASHPMTRMRDPVIYGYDGQAVRSSRFNTVPKSAKERGLDTPEN